MSFGWKAGQLPTGIGAQRHRPPLFDALSCTAHELQSLMMEGKLKSIDLVEEYVWRIEEYNSYLHAVSEYAPDVAERAKEMDNRRAVGKVIGPLHGIPVLLKNTIATEPNMSMNTTAGAIALIGSKPSKNAVVVDKLLAAGAVILGKTTVSELSFHKGAGIHCGWSAVDGQGQSPYVFNGFDKKDSIGGHSVPGGSSSGLSIAIAAGLAAGGVGTDTEASITAPAIRASLYSIRPTHGIVSRQGIVPIAHSQDTPGTMAKDVEDLSNMLAVLVDGDKTAVSVGEYTALADANWGSIRIGTLDPNMWQYPEFLVKPVAQATKQMVELTKQAYSRLRALVGVYHDNVELRSANDFMHGDQHSIYSFQDSEFQQDMDEYLADLSESNVKTLQELVTWNSQHSETALPPDYPDQQMLLNGVRPPLKPEQYKELRKHYEQVGSNFDAMLEKYGIDIIIAPGDCFFTQYATANGYPIAALPLSYLDFNGRPIGLQAIASAHQEVLLLKFMSLYEATFPARHPPTAFRTQTGPIE